MNIYSTTSVTKGFYACIPTWVVRSKKYDVIRAFDTNGNSIDVDRAKLSKLLASGKVSIYWDGNTSYIPSKSWRRYFK